MEQLVVTPEVVASKINNMKDNNKSPGVDGITPKILNETVEQISMQLVIPLFKIGSRNKSVTYRSVSLISVICKVLSSIIRDHNLWWTFSANLS